MVLYLEGRILIENDDLAIFPVVPTGLPLANGIREYVKLRGPRTSVLSCDGKFQHMVEFCLGRAELVKIQSTGQGGIYESRGLYMMGYLCTDGGQHVA